MGFMGLFKITVVSLLALILFTGCNNSDDVKNIKFAKFDDGVVYLYPKDAHKFDKPIKLEGENEKIFTSWPCKDVPAVYWSITIPEDGDYEVTVFYSRAEAEPAKGSIDTRQWDETKKDWAIYQGIAKQFPSTGDWEQYDTASRTLTHMQGGMDLLFSIEPGANAYEESEYFKNLQYVIIQKL